MSNLTQCISPATQKRLAEICFKLGTFFIQMTVDNWKGISDNKDTVKARAVQLR